MNEIDWYVQAPGHQGFFKASCSAEAKRQLVAKVCDDFQAANGWQKTRSKRRFLLNRARAWRVSA